MMLIPVNDILNVLTTLLTFGITISLLVFIHEGGHFLVAKWAGVWVHEFAIGFGPAVWRKKKGETQYTFRLLPLGGFVRMAGEEAKTEEDQEVPQDRLFSMKKPFARMAIIFAGPIANIIFAILMMVFYINIFGVPFVEVGGASSDAPSARLLQTGDKIIKLNNEDIYFIEQVQTIVQRTGSNPIPAVIERGGQQIALTLEPYYDNKVGRYLIGISFNYPLNRIAQLPADSELSKQQILQTGDYILAINGTPTPSWLEVVEQFKNAIDQGGVTHLRIERGEQILTDLPLDTTITNKEEIDLIGSAPLGITSTTAVVERVTEDSYLFSQGMRSGDRIVSANGNEVNTMSQLVRATLLAQAQDQSLELTLDRAGQRVVLDIQVVGKDLINVLQGMQLESALRSPSNVFSSVSIGFKRIIDTVVIMYQGIESVFRGQTSAGDAFRGPVGIAKLLGWSLTQGFDRFFQLVALLSLVLGIFNLVPFPALDGSRILFIFVELVRGKPIAPEKEGWVHYIGFILLMGLIVIITWQDIRRLFTNEL